jgi:hypothetical protein
MWPRNDAVDGDAARATRVPRRGDLPGHSDRGEVNVAGTKCGGWGALEGNPLAGRLALVMRMTGAAIFVSAARVKKPSSHVSSVLLLAGGHGGDAAGEEGEVREDVVEVHWPRQGKRVGEEKCVSEGGAE